MKRFFLVFGTLSILGCAAGHDAGSGGSGGGGEGAVSTTASTSSFATSSVATVASSSATGGCAQDCSAVPVPECYESVCNQQTHSCEIKPLANGADCEDGLFCTDHDTCHNGSCEAGDPLVCVDTGNDPCLTVACDEDADACTGTPVANGTTCVSTDLCTTNAICQNGTCLGAPKDCSATMVPDDCHLPACEAATGNCVVVNQTDGVSCVSGDVCESGKTCTAGVCSGTPVVGCTLCSEVEPNGTIATANDDSTCTAWGGAIAAIGDKDYYAVDVTVANSRIDAEVSGLTGPGSCPSGFDSVLRLYNSAGTQLATDDQGGVSPCSHIKPTTTGSTNLAVGTYYVEVEEYLNDGTSPPYLVTLGVFPPGCGNSIIEGTEQCDMTQLGTATCASIGMGFVSGTLGCTGTCTYDTSGCHLPGCGDGILTPPEVCDDANLANGDACDDTCHIPACPVGQTQVTVSGTGAFPIAIPDSPAAGITSPATVTQTGLVQSIWVRFDITHTYQHDLFITLTSPGASVVTLVDDVGSGNDNFTNVLLSSLATTPILSGVSPFTGVFLPTGSFTPVIGAAANGTWTLGVQDQAAADIGTLNSWSMIMCVQ